MIDRVMSALFKATDNMRVTPGKQVDKAQQKPFTLDQNIVAGAKEISKVHRSSEPKTAEPSGNIDGQDQLSYVPLPLRTPMDEKAHFYLKLKDLSTKTDLNGQSKLIFHINTDTLGPLWFTLTTQLGSLSVQCITESTNTAEIFRAASLDLQRELTDTGFQNVIVSCRIQPGIRGIADIDPDFASAEAISLVNVQV